MARVEFADSVTGDFERILDFLLKNNVADAATQIDQLTSALSVLEHSPHIGRPVGRNLRELVIGKRARAYVALYRYVALADVVLVLAVRSQREAGYSGP
jgi:plasmid stabilization system protein ParE